MVMVYCKECGTEISVLDKVCPYCGHAGDDSSAVAFTRSPRTTTMKRPVYVAVPCRYCASIRGMKKGGGVPVEGEECPVCGGSGKIVMKKPYAACSACKGTGVMRNGDGKGYAVCDKCGGTGWVSK